MCVGVAVCVHTRTVLTAHSDPLGSDHIDLLRTSFNLLQHLTPCSLLHRVINYLLEASIGRLPCLLFY